jgi:hypothetical protein
MADSLADLGEPVSDRTLVLNVIRGLAVRFEGVGRLIRLTRDFPTFLEARSALILEELTMDQCPSATSTALITSGSKPPAGGFSSSDRTLAKQQGSGVGAVNNGSTTKGSSQHSSSDHRGKRAGRGSQQSGAQSALGGTPPSTASPGGVGASWPSPQYPWTGAIHMWPG